MFYVVKVVVFYYCFISVFFCEHLQLTIDGVWQEQNLKTDGMLSNWEWETKKRLIKQT